MFDQKTKVILNKLISFLMIIVFVFTNLPFSTFDLIKDYISNKNIVDTLYLSQIQDNTIDNFVNKKVNAALNHYTPNSQSLVTGTESNITSATAAAAGGTNIGSWRGTLSNDNFHWTTTGTGAGIDTQLNVDNVYLNGANKIEIQTEVDLDAAVSLAVQICDWVSPTGVDNAADAQCTGGGWRSLNTRNTSNAIVGLTTTTTPVSLRWHIYDGYFVTGSAPGTPISTPLTNFISQDATQRVKVRYYSTTASAVIDIDYLRVRPFIDSVYEPADFVRLSSGGSVTGYYINANGPFANTTISQIDPNSHDGAYITVPGTSTASEFYFIYKNIKTYEGMNTILVKSDYSCANTGINITPRIYNFNTSSWENLTSQTIACSATDTATPSVWAKNNITISHYINSSNEMRLGWVGSASHATAHIRIDSMYMILGTTNSDTTNCEIPIGTGTVANCSNTRDIDTLGTPSTWDITAEDESTNIGTGDANSYYPFDIDNDATASEEGAAAHIPFSVTVPSNAQVTGEHFALRFIGRSAGTTAVMQAGLKDYSGYNTNSTGGYLAIGTTSSTTAGAYLYEDSISARSNTTNSSILSATAYGQQQNPEDYIHTGLNEMKIRLRTSTDGASTDNNVPKLDFAFVSLQWIEPEETGPSRTYHYTPTSQTIVNGTENAVTAQSAAAAAGVNLGSWRATLADDNFHWSVLSTTSGLNVQLNSDGISLNGANKMEIQTELDLDAAHAMVVQICDWVSTTSVDNAADAQCTGGGWRTLNTQNASNADVTLTTVTTPVSLRWHIYDGYFTTGSSGGTPISTPLTNFVSQDSNRRVKIRYYSTLNNTTNNVDIDYLRIMPFIDSFYEPANFTRLNSGGSVTGTYVNANQLGNSTTGSITTSTHDATYITVPGTTTASEFYFSYNNVKTYEGMNTILVQSDYSCAAAGINITPRIYNFNTSSWENLSSTTIACSTSDTATPSIWAKNNININHYVSNGEIRVGWIGSASHATAYPRVDAMPIILGTTNTDSSACEIPIGTGTVSDCANTRNIDTLSGSPSYWTIASEDESTNMGQGEANSYYAFDIDNDATASEEGGAGHLKLALTVPDLAQVIGMQYSIRIQGRTSGTTNTVSAALRDYSSYNTSSTGGYLNFGSTSASAGFTYSDSLFNTSATGMGFQFNAEDYIHTGRNELELRLRHTVDNGSAENNSMYWDFAMLGLQWLDTSCAVKSTGSWSNSLSTTPFDQGSGCRSNNSGVMRAGDKENLVINSGVTLTLDSNTPLLETVRIYGTLDTAGYTLNAKKIEIMSGGTLTAGSSVINISGTKGNLITNSSGTFTASTSTVNLTGNGNANINSGTVTFNNLNISGSGIKTSVSGLNINGTLTVSNGTLNTNNLNFNTGAITINGGTLDANSSIISITGTGTVFDYTSGFFDADQSTLKLNDVSSSTKTFSGGGQIFNNVFFEGGNGGGSYIVSGDNTFYNLKDNGTSAHSISFIASSTQYFENFNVSGISGNLITITSNNTSLHTLVSLSSNINVDYVSVAHSVAESYGINYTSWTSQSNSGARSWLDIASSLNGLNLIAVNYGGYIYTSIDGGVNWTERTGAGSRNWYTTASSADGNKLVAIAENGYIYTSTDGGVNWTERTTAGTKTWYDVASSADGNKLVAVVNNGYIYTSTDGGVTWTERTGAGSRIWTSVASSADGNKLVAVVNSGYIYTSTDGGITWTERTGAGSRAWQEVSSSANGTKLVAAPYVGGGYIYTSNDGGANWTERTGAGSRSWYSLASSYDGNIIAAGVSGGYIYISKNGGSSWVEYTSPGSRTWYGIALSHNGVRLAAGSYNQNIYTASNSNNGNSVWRADEHSTNNNNQATAGSGWIFIQAVAKGGGSSNIESSNNPDNQQGGGGAGGGGGLEGGQGGGENQGGGGAGGGGDIGYFKNQNYLASANFTNYFNSYVYFSLILLLGLFLFYKKWNFK